MIKARDIDSDGSRNNKSWHWGSSGGPYDALSEKPVYVAKPQALT
jgi:hypothetical protein